MRTLIVVCLSIFLLFGVYFLFVPAEAPSLLGIEIGMPLTEAESRLKEKATDTKRMGSPDAYGVKAKVGRKLVTVVAERDDGSSSPEDATVDEIKVSQRSGDASSEQVAELYDKYRTAWTEALGKIDPTKQENESRKTLTWSWETENVEATIYYTEVDGQAESVNLSLSRP